MLLHNINPATSTIMPEIAVPPFKAFCGLSPLYNLTYIIPIYDAKIPIADNIIGNIIIFFPKVAESAAPSVIAEIIDPT